MDVISPIRRRLSQPRIRLLALALLILLIYSNTFTAPFAFDDRRAIVNNLIVHDISSFTNIAILKKVKIPHDGIDFPKPRYIGYLSFALNFYLHGLDVFGYHIVNILIHIINAMLVYRLVALTFKTPFFSLFPSNNRYCKAIAFISALLFACHPVQTQAVTYIVQRVASLATLFCLLSIVSYIQFRIEVSAPSRNSFYILSIISAVLAMFTKEISFTLPLIILFYEIFFFEGKIRKRTLFLLPLILTMLLIPLTILAGTGFSVTPDGIDKAVNVNNDLGISNKDYLFTQFSVILTYLRLLVCPVSQNLDYDYPIYSSLFSPEVLSSLIVLLALWALGLYLYYRSRQVNKSSPYLRLISFGIFWFFITLSVESSIIPISDVIFEHRVYLPSAGFLITAATSIVLIKNYLYEQNINAHRLIPPLVLVIIAALSVATYARNEVWQSEVSLWVDTAAKSPQKARPHNNLEHAYFSANRLAEAEQECYFVLRIADFAELHYNLGLVYFRQDRYAEAIEAYKKAIIRDPSYSEAYGNLGVAYAMTGKYDEAIHQFEAAIKLKPDNNENHYNLALAYEAQGNIDDATRQYAAVLQSRPSLIEELNNLGVSSYKLGNIDAAIKKYRITIKLKPDMVQAHYNLALALQKQNRLEESEKELKTSIRLKPDLATAYYHLGNIYKQRRQYAKSKNALETALKLKPDYAAAKNMLAEIKKSHHLD